MYEVYLVRIKEQVGEKSTVCTICTDGEIGDEFHYILQCKSFANDRKLCPSQYFSHRINTLKFDQLFQIKNKPILTKLCKFIRVNMMLVLLVNHKSLSSKYNDVISFLLLLFNFVDHLVLSCVCNI